jgi:hypothetical protein
MVNILRIKKKIFLNFLDTKIFWVSKVLNIC